MRSGEVRLHRGGVVTLITGILVTAAGVIAASPIVALFGQLFVAVVVLAYPLTVRQAIRVRSGILQVRCDPPVGPGGGLVAGARFRLPVHLLNRGTGRFASVELSVVTSTGVRVTGQAPPHTIPAGADFELPLTALAVQAGPAFVHGAHVTLLGPLALFRFRTYQPLGLSMQILPRTASLRTRTPWLTAWARDREAASPAAQPVRGLGSDIRELREHLPGDPFKHIAWKASARSRKLIVKEFESDVSLSVYALLDIGPSMRWGEPGGTRLDTAIDICFHLARTLGSTRDRFGVASFDRDVFGFTRASASYTMPKEVMAHLLELHAVVHESFTELDAQDLLARVAEYIQSQDGVNLSLPPLSHDERGPLLGPYDEDSVLRRVREYLSEHEADLRVLSHYFAAPAADPAQAAMRTYCRLRGIDLPYRTDALPSPTERGLSRAVQKAIEDRGGGPHTMVVLTDLIGIGQPASLLGAVRLARAHRHRLVFVCPEGPGFETQNPKDDELQRRIRDVFADDLAAKRATLAAALRSQGVAVHSVADAGGILTPRRLRSIA